MKTICGIDCIGCGWKESCKGCAETNGRPFGGECVAAECYKTDGEKYFMAYKERLIAEFNLLGIADMPPVADLCQLYGAYVNLEYTLPNGEKIVARGECKGTIAKAPGKLGGLTYGPLFIPDGFDKPMGDMDEEEYASVHNHRDLAMNELVTKFKKLGY